MLKFSMGYRSAKRPNVLTGTKFVVMCRNRIGIANFGISFFVIVKPLQKSCSFRKGGAVYEHI